MYPDFPGFTTAFLEWVFDRHDTNEDGSLTLEELGVEQSKEALAGPYAFWSRPCVPRNRAAIRFMSAFVLISLGGQAPHVRCTPWGVRAGSQTKSN